MSTETRNRLAARHLVLECRAMDHRTAAQLRNYLLSQTPGVHENNVDTTLWEVLRALILVGLIITAEEDDGTITYLYNYGHSLPVHE